MVNFFKGTGSPSYSETHSLGKFQEWFSRETKSRKGPTSEGYQFVLSLGLLGGVEDWPWDGQDQVGNWYCLFFFLTFTNFVERPSEGDFSTML